MSCSTGFSAPRSTSRSGGFCDEVRSGNHKKRKRLAFGVEACAPPEFNPDRVLVCGCSESTHKGRKQKENAAKQPTKENRSLPKNCFVACNLEPSGVTRAAKHGAKKRRLGAPASGQSSNEDGTQALGKVLSGSVCRDAPATRTRKERRAERAGSGCGRRRSGDTAETAGNRSGAAEPPERAFGKRKGRLVGPSRVRVLPEVGCVATPDPTGSIKERISIVSLPHEVWLAILEFVPTVALLDVRLACTSLLQQVRAFCAMVMRRGASAQLRVVPRQVARYWVGTNTYKQRAAKSAADERLLCLYGAGAAAFHGDVAAFRFVCALAQKTGIDTSLDPRDDPGLIACQQGDCRFLNEVLKSKAVPKINSVVWSKCAAKSGSVQCLKKLRKRGFSFPSSVCEKAAEKGHLGVLKYLVPIVPGSVCSDVCCAAAQNGQKACLEFLHNNGAVFTIAVMVSAASGGHIECLRYVKANSSLEWNAAICAEVAGSGNVDCLKYVRGEGCEWDLRTGANAASNGHLDCLRYLRENGAPFGYSVLFAAARSGQYECMKYAYENGCYDPTQVGQNLCHVAVCFGKSVSCASYLKEKGIDPSLETLLACLQTGGRLDLVEWVWENGGAPKSRSESVYALALAASLGYLDCVKFMCEKGSVWDKSVTAAAGLSNVACLRYLHEKGCPWGVETTVSAAKKGNIRCLRYAHRKGCPWSKKTCNAAAHYGHLDCLRYAHEHGCPWSNETICYRTIKYDKVNCLRYAHENGGVWAANFLTSASRQRSFKCLEFAFQNGCDLGTGQQKLGKRNGTNELALTASDDNSLC